MVGKQSLPDQGREGQQGSWKGIERGNNGGAWNDSWEPGASTRLIPSESPTDNAHFPKDISNLDIKDNKVPSGGARRLEGLSLIIPTLLHQP